jgi:hypothetical protein
MKNLFSKISKKGVIALHFCKSLSCLSYNKTNRFSRTSVYPEERGDLKRLLVIIKMVLTTVFLDRIFRTPRGPRPYF